MRIIRPTFEILTNINGNEILKNIELAGRVCYKTEEKITDESCKNFVKHIIKNGHHSVIEHQSFTVRFICDRGFSHELVRHRIAAISQESTRYCTYRGGVTFIIPPWLNIKETEIKIGEEIPKYILEDSPSLTWVNSMLAAEFTYISLLEQGWSAQQARSVLPNSLKTEVVFTANVREWLHIFKLRTSKQAHPQMRELMIPLLKTVREKINIIFDDVNVD